MHEQHRIRLGGEESVLFFAGYFSSFVEANVVYCEDVVVVEYSYLDEFYASVAGEDALSFLFVIVAEAFEEFFVELDPDLSGPVAGVTIAEDVFENGRCVRHEDHHFVIDSFAGFWAHYPEAEVEVFSRREVIEFVELLWSALEGLGIFIARTC